MTTTVKMPDYIEVAGVRTPAHWSIEELRSALAKRQIRFGNEEEILAVYGVFLRTKDELTEQIKGLRQKRDIVLKLVEEAETTLKNRNARLTCPKCSNIYSISEEIPVVSEAKGKSKK